MLKTHLRRMVGWLAGLSLLACAPVTGVAQQPPATKRVLLLHQTGIGDPGTARFDAAFADALRSTDASQIDVYRESIEALRLPGTEQLRLAQEYLEEKYADRTIDVIVAQGMVALDFARQQRAAFGHPPIVGSASLKGALDMNDNVTGLEGGVWISETVDLALSLLPATQVVYVVDGTRARISATETQIRQEWNGRNLRPELVYLRDVPLGDVLARIAAAPKQSIVLFVRQTMLNQSQDVDQLVALRRIVEAANAPVFSAIEDYLQQGIVGGYIWRFEANARRMADMARRLADGASVREVPPEPPVFASLIDWRQLRRWRIPESRVPAGSVVLFRPQSFFELHRRYVVGGLLIFTAQLVLIVGLLVQRARRRLAEEESRKIENRYRSVVDTQRELICRCLPDTTLTFVNDAYCRFSNKSCDELLGTKFIERVPTWAREQVRDRIARLKTGVDFYEHPVVLPDGTIGWQQWVYQAIINDRGQLVELQRVGRDITDRKRAEESIGQLETRNSAILRAIPDLMFVLLRDGTVVDYHARDPQLLFLPPEQFLGRTVGDVMPPAVGDRLMDAIGRVCRGGDPIVVEFELPLGDPRHFEARFVDAENDRVLSIVRDVTESKRALALNRDLAGRLISSQESERARIARDLHDDVCQELAAVSVDISHIRHRGGEVESQEVQKLLGAMQRRTNSIAENLRLLSHGLHSSVLHHIGLVAALQAHCAEVERQHHLHVRFFADGDVEPANRLVALSLFRIAQEALRNSAKHGHARHASVSLSRTGGELTLIVADDGRGFDVAAVREGGAGLGLVSIEERARLVKGQATVTSRPGRGSVTNIRVPIDAVDDGHEPDRGEGPGRADAPTDRHSEFN
jgi:PAS domain S-box-containing protein